VVSLDLSSELRGMNSLVLDAEVGNRVPDVCCVRGCDHVFGVVESDLMNEVLCDRIWVEWNMSRSIGM
jgi:hypothetical protein